MKKTSLLTQTVLLALFLMPFALADLSIAGTSSFSTAHNTVLQIPFDVSSTVNVTNVSMTITNISSSSQTIPVSITDSSKLSINAGESKSYTINYNIPQYLAPGIYSSTVNVSAQTAGNVTQSALKTVTITVSESKTIEATSSISMNAPAGIKKSVSVSVKNTGNLNLSNITVTQSGVMEDSDGDKIDVSVTSNANGTLKPGETRILNISADIAGNIALQSYSTTLTVQSPEGISHAISLSVNVARTFCDSGTIGGFFDLDIREPDSGDDFYPQDTVPIEVRVDNRDKDERDVVVTANLYDSTDEEFLDEEVETTGTVSDHDNEDFTLELQVPTDIQSGHAYKVYVKVAEDGEEDTQCREASISVDMKQETHSVVVDKTSFPEIVSCGDAFDGSVTLANIGKRDEDVKVKVTNPELKISEEKIINIDNGDKRTVSIPVKIPQDAKEKNYVLNILTQYHLVSDSYDQSVTNTVQVGVQGGCETSSDEGTVMSLEVLSQAYLNERFGVRVQVFNIGTEQATYRIVPDGYNAWARLELVEPVTMTVDAGRSEEAIVYLTPTLETAGDRRLTVKAITGADEIAEEVTVSIKEKLKADTVYQRWTERLSNLSGFDLATVNIVLIVSIILLVAWILRARRA